MGRTTGETVGRVNGIHVQCWAGGGLTAEIGVLGCGESGHFAAQGDIGSMLFTRRQQEDGVEGLLAIGMLKSMSTMTNLVFVLPMWAVIDEIERAVGAEVELWEGKEE